MNTLKLDAKAAEISVRKEFGLTPDETLPLPSDWRDIVGLEWAMKMEADQ